MKYRPSAALAVRLARRTANSNPLWWSTVAAPPPPTPAPCAATTAATANLRHAASVAVFPCVGAPSFAPLGVTPRPGPRTGGRRRPLGTGVPPTRAVLSSASTVGAGADGTAGGPPSEAQVTAALNDINERFSEARLLLGEARDALGSVYFGACAGGHPFGGGVPFGRCGSRLWVIWFGNGLLGMPSVALCVRASRFGAPHCPALGARPSSQFHLLALVLTWKRRHPRVLSRSGCFPPTPALPLRDVVVLGLGPQRMTLRTPKRRSPTPWRRGTRCSRPCLVTPIRLGSSAAPPAKR